MVNRRSSIFSPQSFFPEAFSAKEITALYQSQSRTWKNSKVEGSNALHVLEKVIAQDLDFLSGIKIDQCVCFALGNIVPSGPRPGMSQEARKESGQISMEQFIVLIKVLDIIRKKHTIHDLYIQEPRLTDTESLIFKSQGWTVVKDPEAFSKITPTTLVFAPFLLCHLVARIFEKCHPAVYLGIGSSNYAVLDALQRCRSSGVVLLPVLGSAENYWTNFALWWWDYDGGASCPLEKRAREVVALKPWEAKLREFRLMIGSGSDPKYGFQRDPITRLLFKR